MSKKISIILLMIISLTLAFQLTKIFGQRYAQEEEFVDLVVIEEKIDRVLSLLQERDQRERFEREISAKLDKVLTNQERIFRELEIVKIRATRR